MGILGRINSVIKSNLNAVIDKMTDPAKEIDLLVVEMEANLKKAREEVIACAANAKRTGQRVGQVEADVQQWQRRAEQAVRAGDDELAREALTRRGTAESDLAAVRKTLAEEEAYTAQLTTSLKQLEERIREVKGRKETLKARARAAKDGRSAVSGGKPFEDFQRLEDRIEAMEQEGELTAGTDGRDAAVEAKFARLGPQGNPQVEDALAELKRKVDKGE